MKTKELKIEGMSCGHCVESVRKELSKIPHVKVESVEIGTANVRYEEGTVEETQLARAIEEAGYVLTGTSTG